MPSRWCATLLLSFFLVACDDAGDDGDDATTAAGTGASGGGSTSTSTSTSTSNASSTSNATSTSTSTSTSTVTSASTSTSAGAGTLVTFADFDAGMPADWVIGAQDGGTTSISTDADANFMGSAGSLRATYPQAEGGVYAWAVHDVSALDTRELYVELRARMPLAKQGLKFLKVFGKASGGGYANTTFGLDYTGGDAGAMYQVSFGDGTTEGNDTANVINFDGTYPEWIGRSFGTATVSTPKNAAWGSSDWGTDWHHFRIALRFNSGTSRADEVADGMYYVEIDGEVYVDAQGLFNRHPENGAIERVELLGWSQNGDAPFEVWYDDVRISTGGFL